MIFVITTAFWKTDKGLKRDSNQDSCLCDEELGLYIVADGMGGHSGGEVASKMAIEIIREYISANQRSSADPRSLLIKAYAAATERIHEKAQRESPELLGMGTTVVTLWKFGNSIYIGNVGDSRAYLYSGKNLWQLTEDHSLLNEQVRAGILTEEQIKNMAGKNVITRSVGYESVVSVDVIEREFQSGETYFLCSDGLSSIVPYDEIKKIIKNVDFTQTTSMLIDAALRFGGDDNVTVIGIKFI